MPSTEISFLLANTFRQFVFYFLNLNLSLTLLYKQTEELNYVGQRLCTVCQDPLTRGEWLLVVLMYRCTPTFPKVAKPAIQDPTGMFRKGARPMVLAHAFLLQKAELLLVKFRASPLDCLTMRAAANA